MAAANAQGKSNSSNNNYSANPGAITLYDNSTGDNQVCQSISDALGKIKTSGSYTIVLENGTYKENGLYYTGAADIRIVAGNKGSYGDNVKIVGHGSNMATEKGRELLEVVGSGNLTLENISLISDWTRANATEQGLKDAQAEVLGFDSTGLFTAYNCSFASRQDTIRTTGKSWVYKCKIEGDVDFIWMEKGANEKVALYESCDITALTDEKDAYVTAPRLTKKSSIGKGVVIWKSTITSSNGGKKAYLFRNPWGESGTDYNQVAFVDCTLQGIEATLADNKAGKAGPVKEGDGSKIGWKVNKDYFGSMDTSKVALINSSDISNEYSTRDKILNRLVSSSGYTDDSNSADISEMEKYWLIGQNIPLPQKGKPATAKSKVTWIFSDATSFSDKLLTMNGLAQDTSNKKYAYTKTGGTITFNTVADCTVSVKYCYLAGGSVQDNNGNTKNFSTSSKSTINIEEVQLKMPSKGKVTITCTSETYLTEIVVQYNADQTQALAALKAAYDNNTVYDFTKADHITKSGGGNPSAQNDAITSATATNGPGGGLTFDNFKWHGNQYGITSGAANATITIPVTGSCKITVLVTYASTNTISCATSAGVSVGSSYTVTSSGNTNQNATFAYTGGAGNLVVTSANASAYIKQVSVSYTD